MQDGGASCTCTVHYLIQTRTAHRHSCSVPVVVRSAPSHTISIVYNKVFTIPRIRENIYKKNRGTAVTTVLVTYYCTYSTSRKSRRNPSLQSGWWLRPSYFKLSKKAINGTCNHNRKIIERQNGNTSSNAIPTRVLRWLRRERSDSGQDTLGMKFGGRQGGNGVWISAGRCSRRNLRQHWRVVCEVSAQAVTCGLDRGLRGARCL
ncbi:hypothetical protein BJV77DRAFT_200489 [Russula vinacea]|nr:hypothetical protein BJV77DRAFT_200489 [Russula vinacea]